jgi:hypothetical protein
MTPKPSASKTHVFPGVALETVISLRDQAPGNYKLDLDPDGLGGLLTISTPMGDVVLRLRHNGATSELTLTIVKKPMLLPKATILSTISEVLREAAAKTSPAAAAGAVGSD